MTAPPLLFKALHADGKPCHGGSGAWSLPTDAGPGEWRDVSGRLEPCGNGLHLCTLPQLLDRWLGPALFLAEWDGEIVADDEKSVVRRARLMRRLRWDDRIARLFACDCADHLLDALAIMDYDMAGQRACVAVARRFADGGATQAELDAAWAAAGGAARGAARDAAGAAARAGAWAAAWAAAAAAAWAAAGAAAWAAAGDAAGDAAWDAAVAAERRWQLGRLADAIGLTDDERARAGLAPAEATR